MRVTRLLASGFLLFGVAACTPQPPPPHMVKLQEACSAGDVQACGYLAQVDAQNRQAAYAAYQGIMANQAAYSRPAQPAPIMQTTRCTPSYNGGMNCTSY